MVTCCCKFSKFIFKYCSIYVEYYYGIISADNDQRTFRNKRKYFNIFCQFRRQKLFFLFYRFSSCLRKMFARDEKNESVQNGGVECGGRGKVR